MNELTKIGKRYGTDKAGPQHNYTEVAYHGLLEPLRDKNINLLELGVGDTGASVKMWKEYLPAANIILFDPFFITDEAVTVTPEELRNFGIKVYKGNQLDRADLLNVALCESEKFDVIIDDASHLSDGMQISLATLFPYLKDGGIYIIEDLSSARSRDSRLAAVNAWLDGTTVDQSHKKIYHQKEIHILDSLSVYREMGKWNSIHLSDKEKSYLEKNIADVTSFYDYNGQENLIVIKKKA